VVPGELESVDSVVYLRLAIYDLQLQKAWGFQRSDVQFNI